MKKIVEFKDGIEFVVESGKLTSMRNYNSKEENVVIPHKLSANKGTINTIGVDFCHGNYSRIFISDGISKVEKCAFRDAKCREVRWSTDCKEIPDDCFSGSTIRAITNIEHVDNIGECAFIASQLREITWPSSCKRIPAGCFCDTDIRILPNVGDVEEIGGFAFKNSLLTYFDWPTKCTTVPTGCFLHCAHLKSVFNANNILRIERFAFGNCGLSGKIDLSGAVTISFENGAFLGVGRDKVIFPYYTDEKSIKGAFAGESE